MAIRTLYKYSYKFIVCIVLVLLIIISYYLTIFKLTFLIKEDSEIIFTIHRGESFNRIIENLSRRVGTKYKPIVSFYGRVHGLTTELKVGEYLLSASDTIADIFTKFSNGDVVVHKLTIVEGWNIYQLFAALADEIPLVKTLDYKNIKLNAALPTISGDIEGSYYPATYYYSYPNTDYEVLTMAKLKMTNVLATIYPQRCHNEYINSSNELIIFASILEKEAGDVQERKKIAGVMINRLKRKMKLDIDATVRYGSTNFSNDISKKELRDKNPYNTYRKQGLPIGAIAFPSESAIYAACNPIIDKYLYYVAMNENQHYFSKNLKEHNKAVAKYIKKVR